MIPLEQIYNEEITDLLAPKSKRKLELRGGNQGVEVADLKWAKVKRRDSRGDSRMDSPMDRQTNG